MKYLILIILLISNSGCAPKGMSNDEIISECKKCESAGMKPNLTMLFNDSVVKITCIPVDGIRTKK